MIHQSANHANHRPQGARCPNARRGSAYLLVLGSTLIVTTMAVGAAMVLSTEITSQSKRAQMIQANVAAQSALELALSAFQNTASERKAISTGASVMVAKVGGLKCVVHATATDGSALSTDPAADVSLIAYAEGMHASQGIKIDITPVPQHVASLDAAMHAAGSVSLSSAELSGGPAIGAGGNVVATSCTVGMDAYATGLVGGSSYAGATASSVAAKSMPSSSALEYFAGLATPITYASIPLGTIEKCVLGPAINPYGAASPSGIYSIDCLGGDLTISNCRLSASLIVWNVRRVIVTASVLWETPRADYPALGMRGTELRFSLKDAPLSEAGNNVNFTPAALPFEGVSDSKMTSVLPNAIRGAIYVEGSVTAQTFLAIEGSLVCTGSITLNAGRYSLNRPTNFAVPPGFAAYMLTPQGGYSRVVQ